MSCPVPTMLVKTISVGKTSYQLGRKLGSGMFVVGLTGDSPLNIQNIFPNIYSRLEIGKELVNKKKYWSLLGFPDHLLPKAWFSYVHLWNPMIGGVPKVRPGFQCLATDNTINPRVLEHWSPGPEKWKVWQSPVLWIQGVRMFSKFSVSYLFISLLPLADHRNTSFDYVKVILITIYG